MTDLLPKKYRLIDQESLALVIANTWNIDPVFTRTLLVRIPIPNKDSFRLLIENLVRVSHIGWVPEAVDLGPWPQPSQLIDILGKIPAAGFTNYDSKTVRIKEQYSVYTALIDDKKKPAAWLESLRALLVMLAWHWAGQKVSSKSTISSAVRSLTRSGLQIASKSSDDLSRLADATSVHELAQLALNFDLSDRQTLNEVWQNDVRQFFLGLEKQLPLGGPVVGPQPKGQPGPAHPKKPGEEIERPPQVWKGFYRPFPVSEEEQAEAPEDVGTPVEIFDIPSSSQASAGQQRIDLYRAKQAIWTRDSLLLPDSYESLSVQEAKILGRYLAEHIAQATAEDARRLGRLALSFVTGRSTKILAAGSVMQMPNNSCKAAWILDIDKGQFRHKPYRPEGAFEPDATESKLLEPVSDDLTLPLPLALATLFREISARNIALIGTLEEMEADISEACMLATRDLGFQVSPGRVRRSISRLLQNEGRDMVATMLICGDTFGLSDAHTYYTCPRVSEVQQLYLTVTCEMFGDEPWKLPTSEDRVGARLLTQPNIWRERPTSLAGSLATAKTNQTSPFGHREIHNALVDYLAAMILDTTGHRPVNALFQLTRGCFDLRGFGAIYQDKKSDPAHACRFVAIPELLAQQIQAYLSHLSKLKTGLAGTAKGHIDTVLTGKAPLLFQLGLDDTIQELTFSDWLHKLPLAWQALPPNASRTNIATRGRDLDAHPESLAVQLGHLETVGYPFSDCSPTIPLGFAADLSPILNQLAKNGGWRCLQGLGEGASNVETWESTGPLRNWQKIIADHEKGQKKALRASRDALRAQGRIARDIGQRWAEEAIASVAPKLAEALATKAKPDPDSVELLTHDDVVSLQKSLLLRSGDNSIQSYASMNALRKLLKRARSRLSWKGFVPFPWRIARRPQGTPFFPRMLTARDNIETLREHFAKSSTKCPSEMDPVVWAFARASVALLLFGFIDSQENLMGVLKNHRAIKRSSRLPDLLLVQWSYEPCRVTTVVGVAAIALAHLAWSYPDNEIPDTSALEKAIKCLLPEKSVKTSEGVISILTSLVGVSNRIELSGAARMAVDQKTGSTSADLSQQIHWIDGDKRLPAPPASTVNNPVVPSENDIRKSVAPKAVREREDLSALAERQYQKLCALFPSNNDDTSLAKTGEKITAADNERGKAKLIRELISVSESNETREVVAALAIWAAHMLEHGTADTPNPAFSTVEKYFSAVGSDLVPLIKERRISDIDEADLTAMLVEAVEMKNTPRSQSLTAREIRNFYRIVAPKMGFPDVELDELSLYLSSEPDGVDAELILPSEVELAIAILNNEADLSSYTSLPKVRIRRQASASLSLMRSTGTRSGELYGSRLRDLNFWENFSFFRVARNRNRRLKTPAANRRYLIEHRLSQATRHAVTTWHNAETQRLTEPNRPFAYLFSAANSGKDFSTRQEIRDLAANTLASVTGRPTERLHRLRHLVGTEALMWASFSIEDRACVSHIRPLSAHAKDNDGVLFPRDYACHTVLLGHATPSTTIRTYLHLSWALFSRSYHWLLGRVNRHSAAAAMGITVSGADRITQRRNTEPPRLAWLNHLIQQKVVTRSDLKETANSKPLSPVKSIRQMTIFNLSQMLDWTERGATLAASAYAAGASPDLLALIHSAADEYKTQLGITFTTGDDTELQRPRVRRNSLTQHLYKLLMLIESKDAKDHIHRQKLISVASAMFTRARIRHKDLIVLPKLEASLLVKLLVLVGHEESLIESNLYEDGPLMAIRVRRKADSKIYSGLELKRILGIVWVQQRIIQLAELQSI